MANKMNRRIVLVSRPVGEPKASDFRLEEAAIPEPRHNEVLVKARFLSLDPYQRGRLSDVASYAPPVPIGGVIEGGTVGEVVRSNNPRFAPGDIVEERLGWQEWGISNGTNLRKIDPSLAPISTANGILGMPGMTAYFGLLEVGKPKPGETVVVSAASGAVGAAVGQIAKLMGCRAVGLAGSEAKVDYIVKELGFDAGINYRTVTDLDGALARACPDGVDVYFDNVGGPITEAVYGRVNPFCRVAVCGAISQYNLAIPSDVKPNWRFIVGKRARIQGFIVSDFRDHFPVAMKAMAGWIQSGKLKYREDVVRGIENAPAAFLKLFRGENFGKLLVEMAD